MWQWREPFTFIIYGIEAVLINQMNTGETTRTKTNTQLNQA